MQVMVIGDIMLDIYMRGQISRISPEAPVPVILNAQKTYTAGGAANVAVNLASMGLDVALYGIVGADTEGEVLNDILKQYNVRQFLITAQSLPTITKRRMIGNGHHIVRIDTEESFHPFSEKLYVSVKKTEVPYVVLSDYNKGSLLSIENYISKLQSQGTKVFVDPKREISAYRGAWFVKPNRQEFIKYIGSFSTIQELIGKAQAALRTYDFQHMLVTLGGEGMLYVNAETSKYYPSVAQQVTDITGAGDTVLAGLIYGLSKGYEINEAILFSQRLAELSVTKSGTYVVTLDDIERIKSTV